MSVKHRNIILVMLFQLSSLWVIAQPKANFTVSSVSGCSPLSETFTNTTSGGSPGYTYVWKLGNSNISYSTSPSAIYYVQGTYDITLIATDASGKTDSVTKTITVLKNPTSKFSASLQAGCAPFNVNFTNLSTPGSSKLVKWLWDFGDGSTSSSQNPGYHTYSAPGKYSVSLEVTDSNGCTGSLHISDYIYVDNPPTVSFSASSIASCSPPITIKFSSTVTSSSGLSYSWDFGDGTTSTSANPTKTYSNKGSFTVKLTVTDSLGCTATETIPAYVFIGRPVASFTYSLPGGCAPLIETFSNTSVGAPAGSTFYWEFGDGNTSTYENPTHTYTPGSYSVTFVVTSPGGCSDTVVMHDIINVSGPYKVSFSTDSVLCNSPYIGIFTNTSGTNTRVISWNFGDKSVGYANQNMVNHTFADTTGSYTITLKVTDQNGCVEADSVKNLVHTGATTALIKTDTLTGCVPLTIKFTNGSTTTSIDSIVRSIWDFGDGTTSNAFNPPPHTYSNPGTYKVKLAVITKYYCGAVDSVIVKTGLPPKADFTAYPDSGCLNMLRHVHFINLTNSNGYPVKADSFVWIFGAKIVKQNPLNINNITYNDTPGVYNVSLIAFNNGACPDTFTIKGLITIAPPWAEYIPHIDTCSLQNRVSFKDTSIGAARVEYYFGDGDSSSLRNPTHVYLDSGNYYPYEVAYDSSNGCTDTFSFFSILPLKGLFIKPPWKVYVRPVTPTTGCAPLQVRFAIYSSDTAGNVVSYGDGDDTTAFLSGIEGAALIPSVHTYTKPGVYKVTMQSTNLYGCKESYTMSPEVIVVGLNAGFKVSPANGCVPLTVTLTDSVSSDSSLTKNEYDMGNGDMVKITSRIMKYTYTRPPQDQTKGFQIKQIVSNGYCFDTVKNTVYPIQPVGQIYQFNLSTCDSVAYQFVPWATGFSPFKYLWIFGKGDTIASAEPTRSFKEGSYNVGLKVTDSMGCIDTVSLPVIVAGTKDSADFDISLSSGACPPVSASFTDKSKFSVPGPHKWYWDFGDGSAPSTNENPSRVYYQAGSFTVTLKITDVLGCTSTISKPNVIIVKGATGEYYIDSKGGCAPATVHFKAVSTNAAKFEWDFGDGTVGSSDSATHIYRNPGTFVPLLLLGDSSGCLYTLPPRDTITVYPLPIPDFGYDSTCSGQPIHFKDMSTSGGQIVHWVWDFGDGSNIDNSQNPTHIYKKNGFYPVKLSVTNNTGCTNSISKSVKYGDIIAGIRVSKIGCLGSAVQFTDATLSDSAIKSWYWLFGDGASSTQQNPAHIYTQKGVFPISLYVLNYKGCTDSLKDGAYITIGDTVAPNPPLIYRVSVVDDHTVEIDFTKNPDYDFAKYLIYVRDESGSVKLLDSVLYANDTIYMEQGLNNLHHSYCFLVQAVNLCGYRSDTASSLYHCTINLDAEPGINEALLNWTPYVGWPVGQYKIYRQGAETPPQFDMLDSVPGSQLKYIDTSVVCYRKMVYRVEGIEDGGNRQNSWSDTASTVPIHVAHVPPADMVRATVENNKSALVEWQGMPGAHVKNWMLEKSVDGVNFQLIDSPILAGIDSEGDQKVDVQNNSYTYRLRILDSCGDLGPYSNIGKTILLDIDTSADVKPYLAWTAYRDWPEGVQYYDIDIENANNSFDWLARTGSGQDTEFVDNITDLNSLPFYTYRVVAHRNGTLADPTKNLGIISMSNNATLRPVSRLFVPNAFTPNGDGINDSFFVEGLYIKEFHIKIFDRWGTKVFESGSMKQKWGGTFKKGAPMMDSYKYLIYYVGVDNKDKYISGWVTILM